MELSTREDLIPVIGDRPAIVKQDGWTVYVSVHDQEYFRKLKELRRAMVQAHPDKNAIEGRTTEEAHRFYQKARMRLISFKSQERCWYWHLRMMPPDWRGPLTPPHGWKETSSKRLLDPHFEKNRSKARAEAKRAARRSQ